MTLELDKTEYLCKLFPNIWPIADPNMEAKFGGVLTLWAQNCIDQLWCHFSYGEFCTINSPISKTLSAIKWKWNEIFESFFSSIVLLNFSSNLKCKIFKICNYLKWSEVCTIKVSQSFWWNVQSVAVKASLLPLNASIIPNSYTYLYYARNCAGIITSSLTLSMSLVVYHKEQFWAHYNFNLYKWLARMYFIFLQLICRWLFTI